MITLFPIAFWTEGDIDARSGTSWFFVCTANRKHPYAAAVMAQEIYETRYKTVRALGITAALMALVGGASVAFGRIPTVLDIAVIAMFSLALAMLFTGLFKPWARELELRGQAIECEVRAGLYHHNPAAAVLEAAEQLTRYDQFRGWHKDRLIDELDTRATFAGKWCRANQHMIKRAKKEAGQ